MIKWFLFLFYVHGNLLLPYFFTYYVYIVCLYILLWEICFLMINDYTIITNNNWIYMKYQLPNMSIIFYNRAILLLYDKRQCFSCYLWCVLYVQEYSLRTGRDSIWKCFIVIDTTNIHNTKSTHRSIKSFGNAHTCWNYIFVLGVLGQ